MVASASMTPPPGATTRPLRAPSQATWDALTPAQRAAVIEALPLAPPEAYETMPEGDDHVDGAVGTRDTLRMLYQRSGRKMYVGSGVSVFYPDEDIFAPDVIAVTDVEQHNRSRWVVSAEGKGVDLALEVLVQGDRAKDLERNVRRYASLGISEYFVFDRRKRRLHGYGLVGSGARTYVAIAAHANRMPSQVLGLDLTIADTRLRFYAGTAMVLSSDEIIHKLEEAVEEMAISREEEVHLREDAERRIAEAEQLRAEATKRREEETRLREEAEQRVRELLAEVERLRAR